MANLAAETKDMGFKLEQVQDFTPTPMTVATIIYYTGFHPYTLKPIYTAKSKNDKQNQHLFFFWHKRENQRLIREKLSKIGREDLIEKLLGDRKREMKQTMAKGRVTKSNNRKFSTKTNAKSRQNRKNKRRK